MMILLHGEPASAQADAHARAIARASCQSGKHSEAIVEATTAVQRDPDEPGARMRLADALVDQGCYQEAVEALEAVQESHPRNAELSAKLRDVRSLVTEQTYIEGLTQAAEGAKLARNQLRCTRLADVTACEDALKSKPGDLPLLLATGDALVQANRLGDALTVYRRASQLNPGDQGTRTKLSAAEALQAQVQAAPANEKLAAVSSAVPEPKSAKRPQRSASSAMVAARSTPPTRTTAVPAPQSSAGQHLTATPLASVAALSPPENKVYSNEAPAGRTN